MIRQLLLGALALSLAACSSGRESETATIARLTLQSVQVQLGLGPEDPPPPPPVTRAVLDRIPFATIGVTVDDSAPSYIVPQADNGGYVTYMDTSRRSLVLRGGALTGTRGFPRDLSAVKAQQDDPLQRPRPLDTWPGQVVREYQYVDRGGRLSSVTLECRYTRGVRERIEIVERLFEVVRVVETCANASRSIENVYWVDPPSGFVWKSRQWTGPEMPVIGIEVIRPYVPS